MLLTVTECETRPVAIRDRLSVTGMPVVFDAPVLSLVPILRQSVRRGVDSPPMFCLAAASVPVLLFELLDLLSADRHCRRFWPMKFDP